MSAAEASKMNALCVCWPKLMKVSVLVLDLRAENGLVFTICRYTTKRKEKRKHIWLRKLHKYKLSSFLSFHIHHPTLSPLPLNLLLHSSSLLVVLLSTLLPLSSFLPPYLPPSLHPLVPSPYPPSFPLPSLPPSLHPHPTACSCKPGPWWHRYGVVPHDVSCLCRAQQHSKCRWGTTGRGWPRHRTGLSRSVCVCEGVNMHVAEKA